MNGGLMVMMFLLGTVTGMMLSAQLADLKGGGIPYIPGI